LVSSYIDRVENQKGHVKICVVTGPPKSNEDFSQDCHRLNNRLRHR